MPNFSYLKKPFFFILLPLFFVWHGFSANYNAIPLRDALILFLTYVLVSLLFFAIGWLFFRHPVKAGIFSFAVMSIHFFFGAIQDLLKSTFDDAFFTRFSFILPFLFLLLLLIIYALRKTRSPLTRLCTYLNLALSILILWDSFTVAGKMVTQRPFIYQTALQTSNWNTSVRPDIFFLLFDEYSSSSTLKAWNFDNSGLDTFLAKKKFRLLPASRSNYNFTEFSMASALNMEYLTIPNPSSCNIKDYNNCFELIRKNRVCATFASLGYKIVNYSVFDLQNNPTLVKEDFLPLKTRLITSQTLLSRMRKDLFHLLLVGKYKIDFLSHNLIYTTYQNNQKIISALLNDIPNRSEVPRFVYSHIEMPHLPFYLNKNGQMKTKEQILKDNGISCYVDYVPPTNEVIKKIVDTIFKRANRPFVIILMGDHGFRNQPDKKRYFPNLNSVYVPSGNYEGFYENISNVNEFRVLLNNLFQASLPLKSDSTILLTDKK